MVYKGRLCMACGGTLARTDTPYSDTHGTGYYYRCAKCGAYYPVLEEYYPGDFIKMNVIGKKEYDNL